MKTIFFVLILFVSFIFYVIATNYVYEYGISVSDVIGTTPNHSTETSANGENQESLGVTDSVSISITRNPKKTPFGTVIERDGSSCYYLFNKIRFPLKKDGFEWIYIHLVYFALVLFSIIIFTMIKLVKIERRSQETK